MGTRRRTQITWRAGELITGSLWKPEKTAITGVLLAPGAGAGRDHPFMVSLAAGLADRGRAVLTFDYPYRERGRKAPDRLPTLLAAHRAAAERLGEAAGQVVLAGKSMGGRVGSHLAGDDGWPAAGLVYYGYPLVPPGRPARDVGHLAAIGAPQLFFAGTRDRLSPPDIMKVVVRGLSAGQLVVIEDADHSFRMPKRAARDADAVMDDLIEATDSWIATEVEAHSGR